MSILKKTLAMQSIIYSSIFQYRYIVLFWSIIHLTIFFSLYFLWSAIYDASGGSFPYTLDEIVTYYILAGIIRQFTETYFEYEINEDILTGNLNNFLLKPFSYIQKSFMHSVGWHSIQGVIAILLYTLIIFILNAHFIINLNLLVLFIIACFIIVNGIFLGSISILFGSISFWFIDSTSFFNTKDFLTVLLTGYLIPIDLLPKSVAAIFSLFPFQHVIFTPINYYLGRIDLTQAVTGFITLSLWTCITVILSIVIWNRGLKRYEGVGI